MMTEELTAEQLLERVRTRREQVIRDLDEALDSEDHERIEDAARAALHYLRYF